MFGIPEKHVDNVIRKSDIADAFASLTEEMGELQAVIGRHMGDRECYATSKYAICEEMTHVLISMNLVARELRITQEDIKMEVLKKAAKADWSTHAYDWS